MKCFILFALSDKIILSVATRSAMNAETHPTIDRTLKSLQALVGRPHYILDSLSDINEMFLVANLLHDCGKRLQLI